MSSSVYIHMYIRFSIDTNVSQQVCHLLPKEAVEVIGYTGMDGINPPIVVDCFFVLAILTEQVRGNYLYSLWLGYSCLQLLDM